MGKTATMPSFSRRWLSSTTRWTGCRSNPSSVGLQQRGRTRRRAASSIASVGTRRASCSFERAWGLPFTPMAPALAHSRRRRPVVECCRGSARRPPRTRSDGSLTPLRPSEASAATGPPTKLVPLAPGRPKCGRPRTSILTRQQWLPYRFLSLDTGPLLRRRARRWSPRSSRRLLPSLSPPPTCVRSSAVAGVSRSSAPGGC